MRYQTPKAMPVVAVLGACCLSTIAIAQTDSSASTAGLEEVIVTAQKREQSLQDVPIAVTAVSDQAFRDAGVLDIKDLTILTPSLVVRSSGDDSITNARIRGVGTAGEDDGLESSVGLVIDGVYRPRLGVGIGDLGEVERIEVLAGPQGTLFGRNNSAGVINVVTQAPSFDFGVRGEATAGNYGALGGSGSITGPIVDDKLAGRLFVAARQHDGYNDVRTGDGPRTSREDKTQDYQIIRGQLLFTPTDSLTARLIADYSKRDEECCLLFGITDNPTMQALAPLFVADGGVLSPADPDRRIAFANRDATQDLEDQGVSLQLDWDTPWLGDAALTSITGWRDWTSEATNEFDWTSVDLYYYDIDRRYQQLSQELRLAGKTDRMDWLVGMHYSHEVIDRDEQFSFGEDANTFFNALVSGLSGGALNAAALTGGATFAGTMNDDSFEQTDDTWALFTHETFHLTEQLHLTVGARYTSGERELKGNYSSGPGASSCAGAINQYNGANPGWQFLKANAPGDAAELLSLLCVGYWDVRFSDLGSTVQERTENEWSGTINLSYDITPDFMTYVAYARGYKGGGFNFQRVRTAPTGSIATAADVLGTPNPNTSFVAEFVDNYELGMRSQWFNRTLTLNATLFHEVFTDFQRNDFRGTAWYTFSVPEVVTEGIDMDFAWRTPLDGLNFRGGFTFSDATTSKSSNPPPLLDPALLGRELTQAPRFTASLGTAYEMPVGQNLTLRTTFDALWTDEYLWRVTGNPNTVDDELRLNARIALGQVDGRWSVELWGQNLLDETHPQAIANFPLNGGSVMGALTAPRTYGITVRASY